MQTFTQIIGLPVISIYNCEFVGTVMNMQLNKGQNGFSNLVISSDEDDLTYLLPIKNIYSVGSYILIRNKQILSISTDTFYPNIVNLLAVGLSGESFGRIKDIELTKNFKILNYVTDKKLDWRTLLTFNQNLAIFNDLDKKVRKSNFARKIVLPKNIEPIMQEVTILNQEPQVLPQNTNYVSTPKTITARLPNNFKNPY